MIINLTVAQVLQIHNERIKLSGSFMELINRTKIERFYQDNYLRINRLVQENGDILKEFYVFKDDGSMAINEGNPILVEGKTDEEFNEKYKEFNLQIIPITI